MGRTPRLSAYAYANYDVARSSRLTQVLNEVDFDGDTALHLTAHSGSVEETRWLLNKGANMHILNKKRQTPSDIAEIGSYYSRGCGECVRLFNEKHRETRSRAIRFKMGQHKHIGEKSIIRLLSPEQVREVCNYL